MKRGFGHIGVGVLVLGALACGGDKSSGFQPNKGTAGVFGGTGTAGTSGTAGTGGTSASAGFGSSGNMVGPLGTGTSGTAGSGGTGAPANATCNDAGQCTCSDGSSTSIEGYVYDPAGKNPLYNVTVYIPDPSTPLPNLDSVPLGCGCSQLYPASVLATSYPSDVTGHFVIPCAPSGMVSLVVQTGKWRRQYDGISVTANAVNQVPMLTLPADSTQGSLPNIAISTGGADSLECLPLRIGVSATEYVLGSATGGHMHIYTGAGGAVTPQGSAQSNQTLWDSQADLNQHDVVLLSCEGAETDFGGGGGGRTGGGGGNATTSQTYLMNYANAGGRVFASHFHYAWFNTGPFNTAPNQIATWLTGANQIDDSTSFPGDIDTTLASGAAFPEGTALEQWLSNIGALTNNQLPIWFARYNVQALLQPPSTEWIHLDQSVMGGGGGGGTRGGGGTTRGAGGATQYFSVDTPIGASAESVCGRVVYSDLHVSGGPGMNAGSAPPDYPNSGGGFGGGGGGGGGTQAVVPTGCAMHPLTPQEDALEFMLFDLTSCLVPIGQAPPLATMPR
ncbi:MAG: hypothetical protein FWD17_05550 [Polyangiaceae bacterium]|nr:hypothetical protein [Polyangiaceae bacterium]